ncbi:MAG: hypothetical protein ACI4JQ_02070 [Ruminococcus sp.]
MAVLQGIQGANSVQEKIGGGNSFAPLPAGGYVCRILDVGVDKTSNGKQYIKLRFDVAEGEYASFFQKRWNADAQSQYERKWKGVFKIFLPVFNGNNDTYMNDIATYKGKINTIARSNCFQEPNIEQGYDPDIFKGCTIGILFRDREYDKNRWTTEPAFLCEPQKIRSGDFEIPAPRKYNPPSTGFSNVHPVSNGSVFSAAQMSQNTPQQAVQAPQSAFQGAQANLFQHPAQTSQNAFQRSVRQTTPTQQSAPAHNAAPAVPQSPALGDLSDFEEIVPTGPVPF